VTERAVLAVDLGGTSLRAALIDPGGGVLASHALAMPVGVERIGWSEADPALWWQALGEAAEALADQAPAAFGSVKAIAIAGFTRSQVFVGRDGVALRPAILWRDTRAESLMPALLANLPLNHPETAGMSAFHPLARIAWLRQEEPVIHETAAAVLEPKDYLNLRLAGRMAGDIVSQARLAAAAQRLSSGPSLFDAAGLNAALLPELLPPVSVMGRVRAGLPGALATLVGTPVVTMANDTWSSVLGLGALTPAMAYNLSGTTEVFGVIDRKSARAEGLLSVDWSEGLHQLGGPSQSGGDTLVWLIELLRAGQGPSVGQAVEELLAARRDPEAVLFLPYLQGERTPHWDPDLRGAFIGLNRKHGPADLAFAVLEGIAFLNRMVLDRAEAATGRAVSEIRFGGGGAANVVWRRIKADVMNRPVVTVEGEQQGLSGAAAAAWTAIGRYPDLAAAQAAMVRVASRQEPDPAAHAVYNRLYALWRRSETALAGISRELAALPARAAACEPGAGQGTGQR
jgi:xylulokinase